MSSTLFRVSWERVCNAGCHPRTPNWLTNTVWLFLLGRRVKRERSSARSWGRASRTDSQGPAGNLGSNRAHSTPCIEPRLGASGEAQRAKKQPQDPLVMGCFKIRRVFEKALSVMYSASQPFFSSNIKDSSSANPQKRWHEAGQGSLPKVSEPR